MSDAPVVAVLMEHLDVHEELATYLTEKMFMHAFGNPLHVYDGPKDTAALDRLDRAVAELVAALGDMTEFASDHLMFSMIWGHHHELIRRGTTADDPEFQKSDEYAHETGQPLTSALYKVQEEAPALRASIRATRREIESSEMTRKSLSRMNLEGLQMVKGACFVWEIATEQDPPASDVNMASPFGRFLAGLFDVCEIRGDPRSAFRTWARVVRGPHFTKNKAAK